MFLLATTDIKMSGEKILTEYKTQGTVEKKFQQLKSPQFVSSLFLTTPKRVEALSYMMLMTLMILSVMEHVVRREMQKEELEIIGPGKIKMKTPSLVAILRLFEKMLMNHPFLEAYVEIVEKTGLPISLKKIEKSNHLAPLIFELGIFVEQFKNHIIID